MHESITEKYIRYRNELLSKCYQCVETKDIVTLYKGLKGFSVIDIFDDMAAKWMSVFQQAFGNNPFSSNVILGYLGDIGIEI